MENLNKIIEELKDAIIVAKEKQKPKKKDAPKKKKEPSNSNDDKGRTQGRIMGSFVAPELENGTYEVTLSNLGTNTKVEIKLENVPCGNDPRILLDWIKGGIPPVIEISKENITVQLVYNEGLNRH